MREFSALSRVRVVADGGENVDRWRSSIWASESSAEHREGFAEALCQISRANGKLIMDEHASITLNSLVRAASDERSASRASAARGLGALAASSASVDGAASPYLSKLMPVLSKLLRDAVIEVRYAAVRALRVIIHAAGPSEMSVHFESFMNALAECGDRRTNRRRFVTRLNAPCTARSTYKTAQTKP